MQPFVLTTDQLPLYDIRYLGKQNADEIACYVFAVKPKKLSPASAISKDRSGWTTATSRS